MGSTMYEKTPQCAGFVITDQRQRLGVVVLRKVGERGDWRGEYRSHKLPEGARFAVELAVGEGPCRGQMECWLISTFS